MSEDFGMPSDEAVEQALRDLLGPKNEAELHRRRLQLIAENVRLRNENEALTQRMDLITQSALLHVGATTALRAAVGSILDIVDELCMGLAVGDTPDRPWAEVVSANLSEHRATLGLNKPEDT